MDIQSFLLGVVAGVVGMLVLFWRLALLSKARRRRALCQMARNITEEEWTAAKVLNMATDPDYAAMVREREAVHGPDDALFSSAPRNANSR